MPLKLDLHVHTWHSNDSLITQKDLAFYAKKRGLDGVAVTDHGRLDGALKIAKMIDLFVIPGIEIYSSKGHIVGLNVEEQIPNGLGVDETVDNIHKAGGIAVACHPTTLFKGGLGRHITSGFDAVETINSSAFPFRYSVRHSMELAASVGIESFVAGSDAHYGPEIGFAHTVVEAEPAVEDVVKAIIRGSCQPFGRAIPLGLRLRRTILTTFGR